MNWKKNGFSYVLWLFYSAAAIVFSICAAVSLCTKNGYEPQMGLVLSAAALVVAGVFTLSIHKAAAAISSKKSAAPKRFSLLVWECICAVVLLGAGIFFRIQAMFQAEVQSAYFEAARVTEGQAVPMVVHGAVYAYLQLLHLLFLVFGNKMMAAVIWQMILQITAFLLLYIGVKRTAGRGSALVMLAFAMLSPGMAEKSVTLSPDMLFLLFFAGAFVFAAILAPKKSPAAFFCMGLLVGIVCYFDITGCILLLFLWSLAFWREPGVEECGGEIRKERHLKPSGSMPLLFLSLAGFCVGLLALIFLDAFFSGKNAGSVIWAWLLLYCPEGFSVPAFLNAGGILPEGAFLAICLLLGVFSFWCRRGAERLRGWAVMLFALWMAQCFGVVTQKMDGSVLLFFLLSVLAGIGVQEIFAVSGADSQMEKSGERKNEKQENKEQGNDESEAETAGLELMPEFQKEEAKPKVKYIENPLPLPKRHERRTMDYRLGSEDGDDFDVSVSDDDDFDI